MSTCAEGPGSIGTVKGLEIHLRFLSGACIRGAGVGDACVKDACVGDNCVRDTYIRNTFIKHAGVKSACGVGVIKDLEMHLQLS